jgi:excisionase family DNA binding protein
MALLTSQQVCEILGIKPNNLYQIIHRKQINFVEKRGKNVYFNSDDVDMLKAKRAPK